MTDREIVSWLQGLAPTDKIRRALVLDLLKCPSCISAGHNSSPTCLHRVGDFRGNVGDVKICTRALELIQGGTVPQAALPISLPEVHEEIA